MGNTSIGDLGNKEQRQNMTTVERSKPVLWPLIFHYKGTIIGKGFLVEIAIQARVLARPESDGVWVDGVNPGAIAVGAPTLRETEHALRSTMDKLFIDFANEANDFDAFRSAVVRFVEQSDPGAQREWEDARADVRAGAVPAPDGLRRETTEAPFAVDVAVKRVETATPKDNLSWQQSDANTIYAAAA